MARRLVERGSCGFCCDVRMIQKYESDKYSYGDDSQKSASPWLSTSQNFPSSNINESLDEHNSHKLALNTLAVQKSRNMSLELVNKNGSLRCITLGGVSRWC